uniref:Transporter n=1 Tax=Sinonovacula rivularis TaxID=489091 RepID=A0AA50AFA8_9BIVA|nr:NTT9 [Sinonovacula rivularis]
MSTNCPRVPPPSYDNIIANGDVMGGYKTDDSEEEKDVEKIVTIGTIRDESNHGTESPTCHDSVDRSPIVFRSRDFDELQTTDPLLPRNGDIELSLKGDSAIVTYEYDLPRPSRAQGTPEASPERETWGKKLDFLLSVIGFAVDLGNVWRFPYICFKNGGGAFLVPYFLMLIFLGLPLFYMELALGQYHKCGALKIWANLCPMFTGVGFAICLVATYVGMYYNTIIAWAVFYMFASFRSEVPWSRCNNEWNSPDCISAADGFNRSLVTNNSVPAALEYFRNYVLEFHRSPGIGDIGAVKPTLCLCLLAVMVIIYFSLWRGIKSSGKAVWITATVPYIVLLVLLVRGCMLPGAKDGIRYYVTPQWERLLDIAVWLDAAAQIFFSLGPGFGTLLALSSYNKFNNNCYMDAMVTASINCFTSLLAGFVVFAVLGYMAHIQNSNVEALALQGPGLVFFVYPEAIATLDLSVFWAIIFFVLLITLGLDSTFGGLESVITAFCDISPTLAKRRELFVLAVVVYCFLGGIPTTTYGGQYVITLMDTHAAPVALIFICFIEAIAVNWFYGVQRFSNDIERMLGFQPGLYWKVCWVAICPSFLFILFVLSIVAYSGLTLENYVFPTWAEVVGWLITCSSLVCIPAYIVYMFITVPGNVKQKLEKMIKPLPHPLDLPRHGALSGMEQPTPTDVTTINESRDDPV